MFLYAKTYLLATCVYYPTMISWRQRAGESMCLFSCSNCGLCQGFLGMVSACLNISCMLTDAAPSTECMQCDLWRPLRLPGILVGDGRLGGISTTIAAYECLRMRGYDIPAIVLTDNGLQNWKYLEGCMPSNTFVLSLPECPPAPESRSGPLRRTCLICRSCPIRCREGSCTSALTGPAGASLLAE